jgi:hypothetical protein
MDKSARRAAVAAYKERKPEWGVFAVRCLATGQAWVGESRHLDTQQNGLWFALRHGSSPYRALQAAWTAAGEGGFVFEALERLPGDTPAHRRVDLLKARAEAWRAALGALPL